jgi:trimethylguanosine synthase
MSNVPPGLGVQGKVTDPPHPSPLATSVVAGSQQSLPLAKYHAQRHRLFHRFSEGILLDDESWYSVTPEKIAVHHAHRVAAAFARTAAPPSSSCSSSATASELPDYPIVVDAFSGAGGNAIQFAAVAHVLAIDLSPTRAAMAAHNARVYGVSEYIDFIVGDAYTLLPSLASIAPDFVFLSPPWGGPDYISSQTYDVAPFVPLIKLAASLTPNYAILLPRNASEADVERHFGSCEFERNFLGNVLKTITVYFGSLRHVPS